MDDTEVYQDAAGEWRWRVKAPNGEIIADSGEGYTRREDAERAMERVFGESANEPQSTNDE